MTKNVGILVGSLRQSSYSKSIAKEFSKLFPDGYNPVFLDISELPLYNEDLDTEGNVPESWTAFRAAAKDVDAFLFVTPEYNRSVPGALKNALDVGSRPYGQSIWDKKVGAIVSLSPGAISGFGANHHLRQSLVFLNVLTLQQPEAYLAHVDQLLNEDRSIKEEGTVKFFQSIVDAFVDLIEKNA
ncbi:MAG: NADPH-dependent FMN reductase [Bavariicoccus seileri]|uniref:NADPH-dependent FMN reductase n=1 Tax=Bavariicoccus seileri TaxID=549685 RepID=UPI003F9AE996